MATVKQMSDYLFSVIDAESLELEESASAEDKIRALHTAFMNEVGHWNIPREGLNKSLLGWLQGLPGYVCHAYANWEIIQLLESWGDITEGTRESTIEKRIYAYWHNLAYALLRQFQRYNLV